MFLRDEMCRSDMADEYHQIGYDSAHTAYGVDLWLFGA